MHEPIPAEIRETPNKENGYFYIVKTETRGTMYLSGRGAPRGGKIGDKGTVQYHSGCCWGLFFWETENAKQEVLRS